jgi:hypothetical protein
LPYLSLSEKGLKKFTETVCEITTLLIKPMTSASLPVVPTHNYSMLNSAQFRLLRNRASPIEPDHAAEAEKERQRTLHTHMSSVVSTWSNTIVSNRRDRQTRLLREREAEEQRRVLLDEEEKKIQKLKRQAQLAEAQKAEFAQRPEVRDVNSQLLLHEVQTERAEQLAFKERKRLLDMKREIEDDDRRAAEHAALVERERQIRRERRQAATVAAEGFRAQRDAKEAATQAQRDDEIETELVLVAQMQRELEGEAAAAAAQKRAMRELRERNMRENEAMIAYRELMRAIDAEEDRRIRALEVALMDEQDRRKAVDAEAHRTKLAARQRLIDAERIRQEATRTVHQDFLDKQIAEQLAKDQAAIEATRERTRRLARERRQEFVESLAVRAYKEEMKKEKKGQAAFPLAGEAPEDDAMRQRDEPRAKHVQD